VERERHGEHTLGLFSPKKLAHFLIRKGEFFGDVVQEERVLKEGDHLGRRVEGKGRFCGGGLFRESKKESRRFCGLERVEGKPYFFGAKKVF